VGCARAPPRFWAIAELDQTANNAVANKRFTTIRAFIALLPRYEFQRPFGRNIFWE
jgi:hypothetical protein